MSDAPCRRTYASDVSDDEWAFVAPYLTLMTQEAPRREHSLREIFNGLRWMVRTGALWRMGADFGLALRQHPRPVEGDGRDPRGALKRRRVFDENVVLRA